MRQLLKFICRIIESTASNIGYLFSKTLLYSIYFNFRYLPFSQAIHLPILIFDTFIIGTPKIKIKSRTCTHGMIRIGRIGYNVWCSKKSTIIFWDKGEIHFNGNSKLTRAIHIRVMDSGILSFGDNFYASSNLNIQCAKNVSIGNNVTIGWNCTILDTDYHHYFDEERDSISIAEREISIGNNCWIGFSAIIMKGCILQDHTIVSAGSTVCGNVNEAHVIVRGNPAQVIKTNVSIDPRVFW